MTLDMVPPVDLAPSLISRILTVHLVDLGEGDWARGETVTLTLVGDIHVPADKRIIRGGRSLTIPLPHGRARIRVPAWTQASGQWVLEVKKSWAPYPYSVRVPPGAGEIDLSELPPIV